MEYDPLGSNVRIEATNISLSLTSAKLDNILEDQKSDCMVHNSARELADIYQAGATKSCSEEAIHTGKGKSERGKEQKVNLHGSATTENTKKNASFNPKHGLWKPQLAIPSPRSLTFGPNPIQKTMGPLSWLSLFATCQALSSRPPSTFTYRTRTRTRN